MAQPQSALRQFTPQSAEPAVRSYNPFNPAFRETMRSGITDLLGGRAMGGTPTQRYRAGMADMLTGGVDVVPGLDLALGVTDTVQAARGGNYGTAAILGGATMLGMLPVVGDAASKAIRGTLDMSQAARMQRAAEQGFNVDMPVYHGTAVDFKQFDPDRSFGSQFWSTTDKAAIEAGEAGAAGRGVIKEMYQRIKNPAGWAEYDKYSTDELIAKGYDGLALPDADGQITYVAFDPSQYRDIKAAFDPAKRNSANLMAGAAGATIGLSALRNIQRDEEPQPD